MGDINWLAVLAAASSMFFLGALWYSPVLFGKAWVRAAKLTAEDLQSGHPVTIFFLAFVCALLMATNLAMFLNAPTTTPAWGATAGLAAGLGWVALGLATVALFERRSWTYMLINGGYMTVSFVVMGLILGSWRHS